MREIVMDTETTGLDPSEGHRIVEIGAVELYNHAPTGQVFHRYINPGRPMPPEAQEIHGLTDAFLRDKPPFAAIAEEFLAFIDSADRLVIHNAAFDTKFLNFELSALGHPPIAEARIVDTLALARRRFPGAPASLDALCRRFGIDNSARTKHGALLDSEILAEVYLELIGGRQPVFALESARDEAAGPAAADATWRPGPRPREIPPRLTPAEEEAHRKLIAALGEKALWSGSG